MPFYDLNYTFILVSEAVGYKSAIDLVETCRSAGMVEQDYFDTGFDHGIPDFDKGYFFNYMTENDVKANIEILEKDSKILQAGARFGYPWTLWTLWTLLFSKSKKHFNKMLKLMEAKYGSGLPMNHEVGEIINFADDKTVAYLLRGRNNNVDFVSFKIGDKVFWG
ncbi:MAG: hypothetical protein WA941_23495 [Nitrososphaeraceae archaeon]